MEGTTTPDTCSKERAARLREQPPSETGTEQELRPKIKVGGHSIQLI
jgi:hypothetical protein